MAIDPTTVQAAATLGGFASLGAGLAIGIGVFGPALGEGNLFGKTIEGIARNPEAQGRLQGTMFITFALLEVLALFAFVISIMLLTQIATPMVNIAKAAAGI